MSTAPAGDLAATVERFLEKTGFPTSDDEGQRRLREEWHKKLLPENVKTLSRRDLSAVMNQGMRGKAKYVNPQEEATGEIRNFGPDTYEGLLRSVEYLCWGKGELAERFDSVDDHDATTGGIGKSGFNKIPGSSVSKLLAICYPNRILPIAAQQSQSRQKQKTGRVEMLELLGLPIPRSGTFGQKSIDANDALRKHLKPHFADDLYGMARFLYWLLEQTDLPPLAHGPGNGGPLPPGEPDLARLARELLVDVGFLEDIVDRLKDKGQVILYGPPGTGKTYLAQELAKVLAPDESCRALVQFHPSTSYEDFFEGYRPAGTDDGGIRYELTPGPLARMAKRASEAPEEQRYVMVIDEINRGNLPRVLGELLFLLEYRNESVQTLYRPDTPFSLPANLWFIGTMNTADRSIALVDAALRRRFNFLRFFPDSGAIQGLLGRWLARENQPTWVGQLVDAVNDELKGDLEGSHLLLGPSHFMKDFGSTPDGQRQRLRRIWEYNIEPFIEDQFFGDPDRIQHYRFGAVFGRHGPAAGSESAADLDADATPAAPADTTEDAAAADTDDEAAGGAVPQ